MAIDWMIEECWPVGLDAVVGAMAAMAETILGARPAGSSLRATMT